MPALPRGTVPPGPRSARRCLPQVFEPPTGVTPLLLAPLTFPKAGDEPRGVVPATLGTTPFFFAPRCLARCRHAHAFVFTARTLSMRVAAACLAPYGGTALHRIGPAVSLRSYGARHAAATSVNTSARCERRRARVGSEPGTKKWRGPAWEPNPATGHRRAPEGCCSSRWGSLHRAPLVPCPYPEVRQPLVASSSTLFAHARPSLLGHTRCSGVAIARRAVGPDRDSASMSKGPSVPSTGSTGAGNWPRVTRHFPSVGTGGTRPALDRARAHNSFSLRILGRATGHTK
jgi:hypothetical protein